MNPFLLLNITIIVGWEMRVQEVSKFLDEVDYNVTNITGFFSLYFC